MNIQSMPIEILSQISSHMEARDSAHLSGTCRFMHDWSEASGQWRDHMYRDFPGKWGKIYHSMPMSINFARIYALESTLQDTKLHVATTVSLVEEDCEILTVFQRIMSFALLSPQPLIGYFITELFGVKEMFYPQREANR